MPQKIRVRFAPSPTGALHIGGVRTALYNYLFARRQGGDFLLRIEDTDSQRFVPGAEDYIIESLQWLGLKYNEGVGIGGDCGPYRQSERKDIYRKYAFQLLEDGKAYYAFDTAHELEQCRQNFKNFQYDASTRIQLKNSLSLSADEVEKLLANGTPYVIRFKIEPDIPVTIHDLIRGDVEINSSVLDDKVIFKSADHLPTYHLANVVDDFLMHITHVIRGEEWLPSTPLHILLYQALGWHDAMPAFAHLPLILKPDGNGKLSKRDGARLGFPVYPLNWTDPVSGELSTGFREKGYLPQALVNFLALLGWNPGDESEIFSIDQLVDRFSLEQCSKAGAKFDFRKAEWFNHRYICQTEVHQLLPLITLFTPQIQELKIDTSLVAKVLSLVKDRMNLLGDFWEQASYFFLQPETYNPAALQKRWKPESRQQMRQLYALIETIEPFTAEKQETAVMAWIAQNQYHTGIVMNAFRLAIVGDSKGVHIFDITAILGKTESLQRLQNAIDRLP